MLPLPREPVYAWENVFSLVQVQTVHFMSAIILWSEWIPQLIYIMQVPRRLDIYTTKSTISQNFYHQQSRKVLWKCGRLLTTILSCSTSLPGECSRHPTPSFAPPCSSPSPSLPRPSIDPEWHLHAKATLYWRPTPPPPPSKRVYWYFPVHQMHFFRSKQTEHTRKGSLLQRCSWW